MNNLYNKSNGPALKTIVLMVRMINNFYGICIMSMYHWICSRVAVNNQQRNCIRLPCNKTGGGGGGKGGEKVRGGGGSWWCCLSPPLSSAALRRGLPTEHLKHYVTSFPINFSTRKELLQGLSTLYKHSSILFPRLRLRHSRVYQ